MELELRKCFMMGVRYILPFVFYGGLLTSLIFLIPESDTLYGIGSSAFNLMIMALAGYMSHFIADRAGLYSGYWMVSCPKSWSHERGGVGGMNLIYVFPATLLIALSILCARALKISGERVFSSIIAGAFLNRHHSFFPCISCRAYFS